MIFQKHLGVDFALVGRDLIVHLNVLEGRKKEEETEDEVLGQEDEETEEDKVRKKKKLGKKRGSPKLFKK